MISPLSIKSIFLPNPEVNDHNIFFEYSFDIQETDKKLLNKYVIYKFNQYAAIKIED